MLRLRRGVVVESSDPTVAPAGAAGEQQLVVELADGRHTAVADTGLVGRCDPGDEVIVNVEARELGLGSGGFDIVHVNLTAGLDAGPAGADAHVMKLNYSSLQHAVAPVEGADLRVPLAGPVAVLALHGQLAPLAWSFAAHGGDARLGYVQTAGGALPGGHSWTVRDLRARGLLCSHLTAAPAYGGEGEAVTTIGALHHGLTELGWDVAVCAPGPGIVGSGSALGHGGMVALDSAHAALALGARTLMAPRMSSSDPRERHRGISHHSRTVLELLLARVDVALPDGEAPPEWGARHAWHSARVDRDGYAASGLPAVTMGRGIDADPLFFAAALAAGTVLARLSTLPP